MADEIIDFELRRLKFVEACAYYMSIAAVSVDQLQMTQDLADLITERFRMAKMEWAIGPVKFYERLLDEGLKEKLPNFDGKELSKAVVLRYNFRSMVVWEAREKVLLLASMQKPISNGKDSNGNEVCDSPLPPHPAKQQSSMPSAAPHDFLVGFTVHIKPDVHLDEMIPICARDQHLLYNIFGDKWKSPVVINAYTTVKGQTGFMHNWLSNHNGSQ